MVHVYNPRILEQELENQEIKASLGYTRPHAKERGRGREREKRKDGEGLK